MNKIFTRVIGGALGLAMAVGVGVATANRSNVKKADAGVQPTNTNWVEVTNKSDINETDAYTIVTNNSAKFLNETISSGHFQTTSFTASSPDGDDAGVFNVKIISSGVFAFKSISSGKYVTASAAKSGSAVMAASDDYGWSFSNYSGGFEIQYQKSGAGAYLRSYQNTTFRTYADNRNDNIKIYKYAPAINIKTITSVELNQNNIPCNYGGTLTATAHYTDNDATEQIVWTSSDETVATIATTSTYGLANITLKNKVGNTTIKAAAAHAPTTIYAEVVLTTTEATVLKYLDVKFLSDTDESNEFTDTDGFRANATGDASDLSVTTTSKVYYGKENTIKFSSSKANGAITLEAAKAVKSIALEVTGYSGDTSSLSVKVGTDDAQDTGTLSVSEYKYYSFTFTNSSSSAEFTISATKRLYVRNLLVTYAEYADQDSAVYYAATILNKTQEGCDESSQAKLETAWTSLSSSWTSTVTAGAKTILNGTTANKDGNVLEKSIARYEQIVRKYSLNNFMSRTIASNNLVSIAAASHTINVTTIIIVISSISLVTLGGFLVIRRKKEQ